MFKKNWRDSPAHLLLLSKFLRGDSPSGYERAEGDSMYPTIVDKGLVGVDFEDKNIVNNGIYLIRFPDLGIAIKRLQLRTTGLLVESDNKQVKSEEVDKSIVEQGFVLGRVRWIHNKV
ncbi:MAG: S24 family peptidase [Candidatus Dadabacteria bacterium]|nr:S24 family peptidase [Candidatus Dadabacteria bacterium]